MAKNFKEAVKNRRSFYAISNSSLVSDEEIKEIIDFAVMYVPSAFNSQSTRIVLLLHQNHQRFWEITKNTLQKIVPAESFPQTEAKINNAFASGYGTVLFYEDQEVVEHLQESFSAYKDNFPIWANHTSAMHQFAIWTMLEDAGFGASLQHYNPLIDEAVAKEWNINPKWKLVAEMPFGVPIQEPGEKQFNPLDKRVLVFK